MNKIEKIIYDNWNLGKDEDGNPIYYPSEIKRILKQFGKICFEAGRADEDNGTVEGLWKYIDYEDFLKEIEDETRN